MPGHLQTIVTLQRTLSEMAAADRRLNSIPEWMRELHEEHSAKNAEIEAVEAAGRDAEQQRREAEAALADAEQQLARYQGQLSLVTTQREYGALLKEIDATKEEIRASEQAALEAAERQEQSEEEARALREAFRDLDERYGAELEKWEAEKPAVADAIAELEARSEELRSQVPRSRLLLFDRIYDRCGGDALARVRQTASRSGNTMWHCEGCSYSVRPQVVVEIRNKATLNQCESCKRILFWEDEP